MSNGINLRYLQCGSGQESSICELNDIMHRDIQCWLRFQ